MRQAIVLMVGAGVLAGCAGSPERPGMTDASAEQAAQPQEIAAIHPTAAGENSQAATKEDKLREVRCVDTAFTGSRIPRRLCLTEAQWERWRLDSQEMLRELQGPKTSVR